MKERIGDLQDTLGWKKLVKQIAEDIAMSKKRYVTILRVSQQCSPSDYTWRTYVKEITPETTIADIISWQRAKFENVESIRKGEYLYPMTIQMMEK